MIGCLQCEPYRPGHEDTTSTDEQGAARAEQERATWMVLTTQADIDAAVTAGKDTVQPIAWTQLTTEQAAALTPTSDTSVAYYCTCPDTYCPQHGE